MGRYLHQFEVGMRFNTHGRTITEADVINFAGLTGDFNPIHTDDLYATASPYGGRIAHGPMAIGIAFGLLSRLDLFDGTVIALHSVTWSFQAPVRPGDTVHLVAQVLAVSPHPTKPDRGRVTMQALFFNQHDEQVSSGQFSIVLKREVFS